MRLAEGFRLLVQEPGDGRRNMAVDEALASCAGEGRSPPTLRLYGFAPPTLSLGRFQRARELVDLERLRRRASPWCAGPPAARPCCTTGSSPTRWRWAGGTWSPSPSARSTSSSPGCCWPGWRPWASAPSPASAALGSPHNPDCFRSTGQYEIADDRQRKLIGSAQVLTRPFSLQHGAIPLDGSYRRIAGYLRRRPGGRARPALLPRARSWAGRWATRRLPMPWPAARATRWSGWA